MVSKIEPHKTACENKDSCNIIMPSKNTKILEYKGTSTDI